MAWSAMQVGRGAAEEGGELQRREEAGEEGRSGREDRRTAAVGAGERQQLVDLDDWQRDRCDRAVSADDQMSEFVVFQTLQAAMSNVVTGLGGVVGR